MNRILGLAALAAYAIAVILANYLTGRYGFIPVLPGLRAPAGTYVIGAVFVFRIIIQETWGPALWPGRAVMFAAITGAAVLSAMVAPGRLALASGVTFFISETADWLVYTPVRRRGWRRAAIAGNAAGTVVDTFLFLTLAGFPLSLVPGQLVGKAYATGIYLLAGSYARSLARRAARA